MAVAFDRKLGESAVTLGGNQYDVLTGASITAGEFVVIWVACDNAAGSTTDPTVANIQWNGTSQTFSVAASHASTSTTASAATRGFIVIVPSIANTSASGNLRVVFSAATAKAVGVAAVFTGVSSTVVGSNSGTTSLSTISSSGTPAVGDLLLGLVSCENNAAITNLDVDYTEPGGDGQVFTTGGGATANVSMVGGYRIATSTSDKQITSSWSNDGGHCLCIVQAAGGASNQNVSPTGVSTAESLGSPTVVRMRQDVLPDGVATAETMGSPRTQITVPINGVASAEALGTPTVTVVQTVSPTGVGSAEALGSPTVVPGSVTVAPTGVATAEALGSPSITITVPLDGFIDSHGVGTPTVTIVQTVQPTGVGTAESLGSPTVVPGSTTVQPTGVSGAEALGSPFITITVPLNGVSSAEAVGTPTVTQPSGGSQNVSPTGVGTVEALGSPTVLAGSVTVLGQGFTDTHAVGTPTVVAGSVTVQPTGFTDTHAVGTPTVVAGAVTVQPTGFTDTHAVGTPTVTQGAAVVTLTGIGSAEFVGPVTIIISQIVSLTGVASAEQVGTPRIASTLYYLILPTTQEHQRPVYNAIDRVGSPLGITVYRRDGIWYEGQNLRANALDGADIVYRGGYEYAIDDPALRAELTSAGYDFETRIS